MIQKIKNWLANPERKYAEGVALYLKVRKDSKHDNFFNDAKDVEKGSIQFNLLFQKLANIARVEAAMSPETKEEEKPEAPLKVEKNKGGKQFPTVVDNPFIEVSQLPEDLQKKYSEEIQPLVKEIAHFHEVAKIAQTDDERKEAINKAAELEDQKADAWKEIDDWWKVNKLGEGKQDNTPAVNTAKEAVELSARIEDLKTNINRGKKELVEIKDARKKAAKEKKINEWESELATKSERLNELTHE